MKYALFPGLPGPLRRDEGRVRPDVLLCPLLLTLHLVQQLALLQLLLRASALLHQGVEAERKEMTLEDAKFNATERLKESKGVCNKKFLLVLDFGFVELQDLGLCPLLRQGFLAAAQTLQLGGERVHLIHQGLVEFGFAGELFQLWQELHLQRPEGLLCRRQPPPEVHEASEEVEAGGEDGGGEGAVDVLAGLAVGHAQTVGGSAGK